MMSLPVKFHAVYLNTVFICFLIQVTHAYYHCGQRYYIIEVSHIHANTGFTFLFIGLDTLMCVRQGGTAFEHIEKGNKLK